MIDTTPYSHCECRRMGNTYPVCQSDLMLEEEGKKVRLTLRAGEEAKALVLDGCVFTDNDTKCDAMYLFKGNSRKVVTLVELKGVSDIAHAFTQLAYTRKHRPEDQRLKEALDYSGPGVAMERAFIVSNGMLSKPERERLENQCGIRVNEILYSEPSSKVPDLRDWL